MLLIPRYDWPFVFFTTAPNPVNRKGEYLLYINQ